LALLHLNKRHPIYRKLHAMVTLMIIEKSPYSQLRKAGNNYIKSTVIRLQSTGNGTKY
jgi:hypothetical protein